MSDKPVTINSVEGLNAMPPGSVVQGADGDVYKRGASWWTVTFSSGSWPSSDIVLPATVLAPKPAEPDGDVVERMADIGLEHRGYLSPGGYVCACGESCGNQRGYVAHVMRTALSALSPSDAERKLAAVRERVQCAIEVEIARQAGATRGESVTELASDLLALLDGGATS